MEQLSRRFNLDGNIELQVGVSSSVSGAATQVDIKVSYSSSSLLLHWGVVRDQPGKWVLPSRQPDGTKAYKNRSLRTPFTKLSQEVSVPEDLVQIQAYLRWEQKGKQTYSPEQEKVIGSRNPHNTVKVVFKALNAIETPRDVQEKFGKTVVENGTLRLKETGRSSD
ncbi:hypothetical protein Fmac_015349 [Flemingia macrophylla]|uniref:Uncharacterized protein n=1 Tax=Flemingia macrophylla TaxID=520843 RepID=A0ABD1MEC1_9FABA